MLLHGRSIHSAIESCRLRDGCQAFQSVLQAWQTPEHRMWTPEEWATQPPLASDQEEDEDPAAPASSEAAGAEASARHAVADAAVADRSSADATATKHPEAVARASSADAAPAPAAAEGNRAETAEQPVVAATHGAGPAISDAASCDQLAAEAVVAEVSADEAAGASDPPAAQGAKAALASKALTVKERLAACVATERHRITFGKVEGCMTVDIGTATCRTILLVDRCVIVACRHLLNGFVAYLLAHRVGHAWQ